MYVYESIVGMSISEDRRFTDNLVELHVRTNKARQRWQDPGIAGGRREEHYSFKRKAFSRRLWQPTTD